MQLRNGSLSRLFDVEAKEMQERAQSRLSDDAPSVGSVGGVFQVDTYPAMEPYSIERGALAAEGIEFRVGGCATTAELVERGQGAEVVWLYARPRITRDVLNALPDCRLIVRWGVGYEAIDVDPATELGIAIANSPTWCTLETAEHTMGLLLAAVRRLAWSHERMRRGEWPRLPPENVHRLRDRTLGLLGVGRIGVSVAGMAHGFGLRVIGYDVARPPDALRANGIEPVTLDGLLAASDYLSVHVPLTAATQGFVDARMLASLKPGAILINTSRGRVVDEVALINARECGTLGGAALDVFEREPLPLDSPLRRFEHVVLTPHSGSVSAEAHMELRLEMCGTTVDFLRDGWASTIVNPEVRSRLRPRPAGARR